MTREEQIKAVAGIIIDNMPFWQSTNQETLTECATAIVDSIGLDEKVIEWVNIYHNRMKPCLLDDDCPKEIIYACEILKRIQSKNIIKFEMKE